MTEKLLDPGMYIKDTTELLEQVQRALKQADIKQDARLKNAADSILSALIVVLRFRKAYIPSACRPNVELIHKALDLTC